MSGELVSHEPGTDCDLFVSQWGGVGQLCPSVGGEQGQVRGSLQDSQHFAGCSAQEAQKEKGGDNYHVGEYTMWQPFS